MKNATQSRLSPIHALVTPQCLCAGYSAQKQNGFTLIELLVVVLIIGILSAVALPQYQRAVHKAHGAEVLAAANALDKAMTSYYLANGKYIAQNEGNLLDVEMPKGKHFRYSQEQVGCTLPATTEGFVGVDGSPYRDSAHAFFIIENSNGTYLSITWVNGDTQLKKCSNVNSQKEKCKEYFNCERIQVGTSWEDCSVR